MTNKTKLKPLNPPGSTVYRTLITFPRSVYDRLERMRGPALRSHVVTAAVSEYFDASKDHHGLITDEIQDQPNLKPTTHHE